MSRSLPRLKLRCNSSPTNDDAQNGVQQLIFSITDNRVSVPQDTTYQLTMEVLENFIPEFSNTDALPSTIQSDTTTMWTVEWEDLDEDQISLYIDNQPTWLDYNVSTGLVTAEPDSSNVGQYNLVYFIEEVNGCYTRLNNDTAPSHPHTLTVE